MARGYQGGIGPGTLSAAISDTDTTISSARLANLRAIVAPDFDVGLIHADGGTPGPTNELVKITAHSAAATTATVERGFDGGDGPTTPKAWSAGDVLLIGVITAGDVGGGGAPDYILVRDEKAATTNGGTFTHGAWRTRVLNTEVEDDGGHAALATNQITLAAGTYRVRISAPAYFVGRHKVKLRDITNTADLLIGTSEFSLNATGASQTRSTAEGVITLAGATVLEVQHQCQAEKTNDGFGVAGSFSVVEVYTVAEFWKLA